MRRLLNETHAYCCPPATAHQYWRPARMELKGSTIVVRGGLLLYHALFAGLVGRHWLSLTAEGDTPLEQGVAREQPPIDCYDDGLRPWVAVRPGRLG